MYIYLFQLNFTQRTEIIKLFIKENGKPEVDLENQVFETAHSFKVVSCYTRAVGIIIRQFTTLFNSIYPIRWMLKTHRDKIMILGIFSNFGLGQTFGDSNKVLVTAQDAQIYTININLAPTGALEVIMSDLCPSVRPSVHFL